MKKNIFIWVIILMSSAMNLIAQETTVNYVDVVYLNNGSILVGKVTRYELNKTVGITLESGSEVLLDYSDVKRVVQHLDPAELNMKAEKTLFSASYAFREKGWNHQVTMSTLWGRGSWDQIQMGVSAEYVLGYRLNKALGLGIGSGINNYNIQRPESVIPLYIEQRGYFTNHWLAPTYSLAAGYGFAFKNDNLGIDEATGGFLWNASAGLRIGASKGINLLAELGMRYQRVTYTDNWNWEPTSFSKYRYDYLRWQLRIGMTF